jgi:hypothetical protein
MTGMSIMNSARNQFQEIQAAQTRQTHSLVNGWQLGSWQLGSWQLGTGLVPLLLAALATPAFSLPTEGSWIVADRRAEATCVDAVESQGLRVTDVLDRNSYEGGSEVIMRVQRRRESYTVGCDYADNTEQVQLYRLEGESDRNSEDDRYGYDDRYENGRVNGRAEAEDIARQAVEDQLGVDANSEVIRIAETRRNDGQWYVRGDVNGAPFAVRIDQNGSVEDFQLR